MVGICAKDHPLADKSIWQAEDFREETLISYPVPDDMLDLLRKVLQPAGIQPARRNSELTIAIIQLVSSRRGIAALPYWTVMPYLEKGYVANCMQQCVKMIRKRVTWKIFVKLCVKIALLIYLA